MDFLLLVMMLEFLINLKFLQMLIQEQLILKILKKVVLSQKKAKNVTKRRLYLETIEELLPKLGQKYIIDSEQKNLLPLLNLGKQNGAQK